MTDLIIPFDRLLQKHSACLKSHPRTRSDTRDEFLKEAYRINDHITSLHIYLLSIRQAYLSTTPPQRARNTNHHATSKYLYTHISTPSPQESTHLDDTARSAIDTSSKTVLRDLNASIHQLAEVESLRRSTETQLSRKKYAKGVLGRWAAGASSQSQKSAEQAYEEAAMRELGTHRHSVIRYLGEKLQEVGDIQSGMMERRLQREVEKGRSVLYQVRGNAAVGEGLGAGVNGYAVEGPLGGRGGGSAAADSYSGWKGVDVEDEARREIEQQLSPEQLQLFAQENQDMLKQYEDTLDQVRTAERSMLEISELQTTLVQNLDVQSANISQLVSDSLSTTENVGGGNKELKRATERTSTARIVFWASCGLCGFLITWDLIF